MVKGYALSPASGKKKQVTTLTVTLTGKEDARLSVTAKGQKAELLLKARNSVPAPQPVAYFITYNLNGGTDGNGVPTDQQSTEDSRNITTCIPLRTDYVFLGWTDTKDATVAKYQPGAEYTGNKNITLYAVWAPFVLGQYHLKMDKEARGFVLTVSPRFTPVNGYPKLFAVSDADWIVPGKITGSKTYTADTSNVDHVIPYDPGLRYEDKERSEMYFKGGFVLWLKANKNKENWNADSRSGKVTVTYQASADAPEIKQVLNITQNGNNPYDKPKPDDMLKVSPIEISFRTNKADGKDDVTITSNKKGLVWEPIVEKDAKAWLSVEGWQPGMGSGTLSIKVTDNPSPLSRRSVITFKRTSGGNTSKDDPTICVFQPGKDETWLWPSTYYKKYVNGFYNTYFTTITKNDVKTTLSTMHTGIDIKTSDSAVVATLSGVLVYSVETSGLSEMSILLCYQGEMYVSSYVHMIDQVYKGIGTWIDRGKEIGTGWNIGTDFKHLHFRISKLTGTDADDAYKYYCSIRDGHPDSSVAWSYTSSDTSYMIDPSPKDTPYMRQLIRPDQDSFGDAIFSPDGIEYAFDY